MSYTVPVTSADTSRNLENVVNRLQRHCRIGRISPKFQPHRAPHIPNYFQSPRAAADVHGKVRLPRVMISKPFEKFIETLQHKDAALYGRLCHLSPSLFWQEWKKVHPEDFPDGGNSAAHPSSIKLGGQQG